MFIHQYFNFTVKQAGVAASGGFLFRYNSNFVPAAVLQQTLYTATLTTGVRSADKVPLPQTCSGDLQRLQTATAGLAAVSLGAAIMLFLLKQR
jgi:hypothetical protein